LITYLIRRLFISIVVVIGISIVTFLLLNYAQGPPGRVVLGLRASPAAVNAWNLAHGFDSPLWVQYWHYIINALRGNFGRSYKLDQSVAALIGEVAGRSALLSGAALFFSLLFAIPLGIFQGTKRNTVPDYVLTTGAFVTYSMPTFLLGLLLIEFLALDLGWLPSEASTSQSFIGVIKDWPSMILPVATLTAVSVAAYSRYMRSSTLDVLAQDYINIARAKGLSQRLILTRHLLRNACLPIVTLVGLSIPFLLAGNLVTEVVFNYNGIGYLFDQSLSNYDYPVLIAYTLIGGVLTVAGNFIADVSLAVADPRIRLT